MEKIKIKLLTFEKKNEFFQFSQNFLIFPVLKKNLDFFFPKYISFYKILIYINLFQNFSLLFFYQNF